MVLRTISYAAAQGPLRIEHCHPGALEFHFITGGRGEFIHGQNRYTICPGMLFMSTDDRRHGFDLPPDGAISFYFIQYYQGLIDPALLSRLLREFRPHGYRLIRDVNRYSFEELIRKHRSSDLLLQTSAASLALSFLCESVLSAREVNTREFDPLLEAGLNIMQQRMREKVSLTEIADSVGLSVGHFSRMFRKAVGMSPMSYLTKIRLDSAEYLITSSGWTIRAIAEQLGYKDEFHFSRLFKRVKGLSPSAFRNRHERVNKEMAGDPL